MAYIPINMQGDMQSDIQYQIHGKSDSWIDHTVADKISPMKIATFRLLSPQEPWDVSHYPQGMYEALEKEKKRRQLASMLELVRVLLGEVLFKDDRHQQKK